MIINIENNYNYNTILTIMINDNNKSFESKFSEWFAKIRNDWNMEINKIKEWNDIIKLKNIKDSKIYIIEIPESIKNIKDSLIEIYYSDLPEKTKRLSIKLLLSKQQLILDLSSNRLKLYISVCEYILNEIIIIEIPNQLNVDMYLNQLEFPELESPKLESPKFGSSELESPKLESPKFGSSELETPDLVKHSLDESIQNFHSSISKMDFLQHYVSKYRYLYYDFDDKYHQWICKLSNDLEQIGNNDFKKML
jgi:hypothetical protein